LRRRKKKPSTELAGEQIWRILRAICIAGGGDVTALLTRHAALQHDAGRPEDVDTGSEDHAADEVRYACLSRPYIAKPLPPQEPAALVYEAGPDGRVTANMSIRDIVEMKRKRKARE
jgi:hypothetical protein